MSERIPINKFTKHHWGALFYIESQVVAFRGDIEWPGTWDYALDLEAAGLVTISRHASGDRVGLTDKGWKTAGEIRRNASAGGTLETFARAAGGSAPHHGKVLAIARKAPPCPPPDSPDSGDPDRCVPVTSIANRKCAICGQRIGDEAGPVYQVTRRMFIHGHCLEAAEFGT